MKARPEFVLSFLLLVCCPLESAAGELVLSPQARRSFGPIQPRISPDGARIAVSYQGAICTMPATGGVLTRLTTGPGWDVEPAWSPDSQRIAFVNAGNLTAGELQIINASDGKNLRPPQGVRAQGPLWWHPDGKRLLGRFGRTGAPGGPAWCDLESGEITRVAGIPESWAMRVRGVFALSPEGRRIVFAEHEDREGEQSGNNGPQANVWRIPSEGGTPEKLWQWPARIYNLCFSADGGGVFITTDRGVPHNDLWAVPLAGPVPRGVKITSGQADEDWPSVSRDARTVIFTDNAENSTALMRHDLTTGERRALAIERVDFRSPTATLRLKLTDKSDGQPTVARVSILERGGKFHAPVGAQYRLVAGLGHFYARGEASLTLPAGRYDMLVLRGPEYRVAKLDVELAGGQERDVIVAMERWVHAANEGWFSGENHIHANYGYGAWYNTPRTILEQVEGEDLNVSNMVVANSDGDGVFDREFFRGRLDDLSKPRALIWWNEEFRSTIWGHMTLFHLPHLIEPIFTGFKDTTNPWDVPANFDIAKRTKNVRGATSYTHPTGNAEDFYAQPYSAKGLPVDVALGTIDTLDVMGTVYDASMLYWYRLLNCGFRLPAAAGTDCFLNRISAAPPGWGRAYVRLPDGLTYENWVAGLKAGRSFVSNGPIIEFTADGRPVGDTLRFNGAAKVRVKGRVRSQFPLDALEVVQDGKVVATGTLAADKLSGTLDAEVKVDRSGWVALRASGPAVRYWLGRGQAAHTNPVYLQVRGKPSDAKADAEFFLKWMDRLEADVKKRDRLPPGGADHVDSHFATARKVYQAIARGDYVFPSP